MEVYIDHNRFVDPWARLEVREQKVIAIDFDETISDNYTGWPIVMQLLEKMGYHVVICTSRKPEDHEDLQYIVDKGYKVYYTGGKAKERFMQTLGIRVGIWIDDNPYAILNDLY